MIKLTEADKKAVSLCDGNYLNSKGAKLYEERKFTDALEYYRLAATLGCNQAISNIGYCYLYGRDIKPNISLAISYFEYAAVQREVIDAAYKLSDIYSSDKWGVKNEELSVYYLRMAISYIADDYADEFSAINEHTYPRFLHYPSLCLAAGKILLEGRLAPRNIMSSYQFLTCAKKGYEIELENGADFYKESFDQVLKLLTNKKFKLFKGIMEIEPDHEQ